MSPEQAAAHFVHLIAAELARIDAAPPERHVTDWTLAGEWKVVVTLARAHVQAEAIPPATEPRYTIAPKLSALQRLILSVMDRQTVRKAEWIAAKVKRGNDGNLRNALANLVKAGLLAKGSNGYGYRLA